MVNAFQKTVYLFSKREQIMPQDGLYSVLIVECTIFWILMRFNFSCNDTDRHLLFLAQCCNKSPVLYHSGYHGGIYDFNWDCSWHKSDRAVDWVILSWQLTCFSPLWLNELWCYSIHAALYKWSFFKKCGYKMLWKHVHHFFLAIYLIFIEQTTTHLTKMTAFILICTMLNFTWLQCWLQKPNKN